MLPRTLRSWDVYMSSVICWSKLYFCLLRIAFLNLCSWVCEPRAQHFKKCFTLKGNGIMHSWKQKLWNKKDVQRLIYLLPVNQGEKWAWEKAFSFNKPDTSAFIFSFIFSVAQFKKVSMTQIFLSIILKKIHDINTEPSKSFEKKITICARTDIKLLVSLHGGFL